MNGLKVSATPLLARLPQRRGLGIAALAIALMAPSAAFASAQISGSQQSVSVIAQNSSLKEILSALSQKFKLQFESSANLDKQISGAYRGSLQRVVSRLLEGYNFIITTNEDKVQVAVLGTENSRIASGASAQSGQNAAATPAATSDTGSASPHPSSPTTAVASAAIPVALIKSATSMPASSTASSSPPAPFELKVAQAPGPVPTPGPSTTSGPVPKPATSQMPMPTPSNNVPGISPSSPSGQGAALPMPTTSKPFPGMSGPTSQTPAASSPSGPASATAPTPTTPIRPTTK